MSGIGRGVLGLVVALTAGVLGPVGPTAPAAAVNGLPTEGRLFLTDLHLADAARSMIVVGRQLWVSSGDQVSVLTEAGTPVKTFTGMAGAQRLATDGTTVYVALGDAAGIAVIDIAGLTAQPPIAVQDCPSAPVVLGRRLFYAFGCQAPDGGIASLDLDDPSRRAVAFSGLDQAPVLLGAASTLVAYDTAATDSLRTYTVAGDGTLTQATSAGANAGIGQWITDAAVGPDGGSLLVVGSLVGTQQLQVPSLATVAGPHPWSVPAVGVAYSAAGTRFGLADQGSIAAVFAATDGALVATDRRDPNWLVGMTPCPHSTAFSADGARMFVLECSAGTVYLAAGATDPPAVPALTMSVVGPKAYGAAATLTVRTPGRPSTPVHLVLRTFSKNYPADLRTNALGVLTVPIYAPRNSAVYATTAPTYQHTAAAASVRFTVPGATRIALTGGWTTVRSVRYAHKVSDIGALVAVYPPQWTLVDMRVQAYVGGTWRTKAQRAFRTSMSGGLRLRLTGAFPRATRMRFVVRWDGGPENTPAPTITSQVFVIR